ncbi:HsdM family class I SAM-dependent methyltransferase [Microbispora corallina]|uniref:HsdM family class I SAM-dependent methyltransferase n=1 Tax=Microbispora corallina TaxID=83302 RepID=UPI00194ED1F4|nr:N-6 DNA methylase [Microbispora corallina]
MSQDATVNAGDIARLADVGRAAVSNWRRRYEDFPQPVGGTASSPLFSLPEIEAWLRRNGKSYEVSLGDRVWQRLRGAAGDLHLGEALGRVGAFLLYLRRDPEGWERLSRTADLAARLPEAVAAATGDLPETSAEPADPDLLRLVATMAAREGEAETFEFLCERYVEVHSRRLSLTRADAAELMTRLACEGAGSVLDPACGLGTLLLAAPGGRLLGQDAGEEAAVLAALRLLLRGRDAAVVPGDALRHDGFPGTQADAVVCDPPFNERAWGHEELVGDPRWQYGTPPRGEPELAWVQHCLAHVRTGGLVAILMPAAAASRRPGRRIRSNLLRAGALRAVVTLPSGGPDLWLLRRPEPGERRPAAVLVTDASGGPEVAEAAWRAYLAGAPQPPASRAVPIIDVLDDEVDVSPARHLSPRSDARGYPAALDRFREASAALAAAPPDLEVLAEGAADWDAPVTTIAELAKAGLLAVSHSTLRALPEEDAADEAGVPVLTADDLLSGGPPTGRATGAGGQVTVRPGDVVASAVAARVVRAEGAVLGPQLSLFRADPGHLDPDFLAGFLRFALGGGRPHLGSSRVDVRRVRVPRLPLPAQRAYGAAFRRLLALEDGLREASAAGEELARVGVEGLIDGRLRPRG